jgi:hypothetical protein
MPTYRVHMIHSVSTTVEVEADTIDGAIEQALAEAPTPTNSSNHGIDPDGGWHEVAVYDESGAQVWDDSDDSESR